MSVDGGAHPRVCEPDIPECVRHPAQNPRGRAPIGPPGSLGTGRFTQAEGTSVGWLKKPWDFGRRNGGTGRKNYGILQLGPRSGGERLQKGRAGMPGTGASSTRGGVVLKGSDKRGLGAAGVCGL